MKWTHACLIVATCAGDRSDLSRLYNNQSSKYYGKLQYTNEKQIQLEDDYNALQYEYVRQYNKETLDAGEGKGTFYTNSMCPKGRQIYYLSESPHNPNLEPDKKISWYGMSFKNPTYYKHRIAEPSEHTKGAVCFEDFSCDTPRYTAHARRRRVRHECNKIINGAFVFTGPDRAPDNRQTPTNPYYKCTLRYERGYQRWDLVLYNPTGKGEKYPFYYNTADVGTFTLGYQYQGGRILIAAHGTQEEKGLDVPLTYPAVSYATEMRTGNITSDPKWELPIHFSNWEFSDQSDRNLALSKLDGKNENTGGWERLQACITLATGTSGINSHRPLTDKDIFDHRCCERCPKGQFQEWEKQTPQNGCIKEKNANTCHKYVKGGSSKCTPCPKGKFQDQRGMHYCLPCPAGQYIDEFGKFECNVCPRDTFSNHDGEFQVVGKDGIQRCTECHGGILNAEQTKCTTCADGSYVNVKNNECTKCPIGKYSDNDKQTRCKLCRTATNTAATTCDSCPLGDVGDINGVTTCCTRSPLQDTTMLNNVCEGTMSNEMIPRLDTSGNCECKLCPKGKGVYTDRLQFGEPILRCAECAAGEFRDNDDKIPTKGVVNGQCKKCPLGMFGGGKTKCHPCPTGTKPNNVELPLSIHLNTNLKLSIRSLYKTIGLVGTHPLLNDKTDVQLMKTSADCPPRFTHLSTGFDPYGDSSLRKKLCCKEPWQGGVCPGTTKGTIQSDEHARRVVVLPANDKGECLQGYTRNYLPSSTLGTKCCPGQWDNDDKCHGLSQDQLDKQTRAEFSIVRKPTSLQDVVTNAYWECRKQAPPHNNNCKLLGRIDNKIGKNAICTYCPLGKVGSDTIQGECMTPKCDVGLQPNDIYDALNGPFNDCEPCSAETFNGNQRSQVKCNGCSAGKRTWGLTRQGFCTANCTPGRWGAGIDGTQDCMACPRGKYSDTSSNNDCAEITNCKIGEFLPIVPPAISNSTVPCPAGKFKSTSNCTDPCVQCPNGQYQELTGQFKCKNCPEGKFQGFEGRSACKTIFCPAGTYRNGPPKIGATHLTESDCHVCPLGKYTPAANLDSCTTPDNTASCLNASGPFCDLDEVRAKIYSCYKKTNWGPSEKFGTLVVCPCYGNNGFGEKAFDDEIFKNEIAKAFFLERKHIDTALNEFYKFETFYRGNPTSISHRARWKHTFTDRNGESIKGDFNFKPMLSHIRELNRSNINGIEVKSFDNVRSFMEADENVCWAMLIEFITLLRTGVITATEKKDTFDKYNAFSENTCEPCCCDRKVLVFDGNTRDEIAAKATTDVTIKTTNINVENIRCGTGEGFGACYNHCSEYISIEYPFCGYITDFNTLCKNSQDACIVFKNVRDVEDKKTVLLSHRWSVDDFTCLLHTPNNRVLIREKCFKSPQCFAYATNDDMVCMIDQFRAQGTTTRRFKHVYEKTTYDEHNQRLRLEHLLSSQSTDKRNSAADCRTHCFASDNCYAWQHSSIDGLCTVLTPNTTMELDFDASKTDLNTQCAESLVSGDITCEKLNNRVFHKEVNRFWLETCCGDNPSTPFAPHGCTKNSTCDQQPQGLTKYCGVDEKKFQQGTNQFYAKEGDTQLKLLGEKEFEYRIGNFRDGFSPFQKGFPTDCKNCFCNWQAFNGKPTLTTNSFCQRRAVTTRGNGDTPVSCGTISAMQARIHFMKSPSCEICPITHKCSTPQTCAKRYVLLDL